MPVRLKSAGHEPLPEDANQNIGAEDIVLGEGALHVAECSVRIHGRIYLQAGVSSARTAQAPVLGTVNTTRVNPPSVT